MFDGEKKKYSVKKIFFKKMVLFWARFLASLAAILLE